MSEERQSAEPPVAENQRTWGKAEQVIEAALSAYAQELGGQTVGLFTIGLVWQIADALRKAGLLVTHALDPRDMSVQQLLDVCAATHVHSDEWSSCWARDELARRERKLDG